jgi:hypothetical protein
MRKWLAGFALVALLVAGCTQSPPPPDPKYLDERGVAALPTFTTLLCKGGVREAAKVTEHLGECNHRVTKPLRDGGLFDWTTQHGPANEVTVAVDPTNPLRVAGGAKDYTVSYINGFAPGGCGPYTVWMGTYWSTDGGITWANDLMPGFPGDPRKGPLTGNLCNTDPVSVFGDDGTYYFSGLNYGGRRAGSPTPGIPNPLFPGTSDLTSASQIYVARSHDGGATFPDMGFCSFGDDGFQFNDKQWFAVRPGGGHMIVTWTPFYATPTLPVDPTGLLTQFASYISYCESTDGGLTWGPQRFFLPALGSPVNAQFSMPAYLPAGRNMDLAVIWAVDTETRLPAATLAFQPVYVAYTEGRITPSGTVFQPVLSTFPVNPLKSGAGRDGTGPSFFRVSTYPVLAVDKSGGEHNGRRYVVWADQPGPLDSDVDVLLRWSDDGLAWSEAVRVNDDDAGAGVRDQFVPWIEVDPHGGVHVAWMDRRNDPQNRLLDVYYAYSSDGGASFQPNVRVTERSFDGDHGHHQGGFPFIGDYIGLSVSDKSAVVFWADTRHSDEPGRQHLWPDMGQPIRGSDVYSATILRDAQAYRFFQAAYN